MAVTKLLGGCLLAFVCLSTGCESMSNTAAGGLIGAGTGAGLGALAGGGKGALIGGLAGGLVGGAVGNSMDQQQKAATQQQLAAAEAARNAVPPVGMSDVIQMTRSGMSDGVIITQIRNSGSTYQLSLEDLRTLQANSVSQAVIYEMQSRPPVVRVAPRPYYGPGYYYAPPPPPPPAIGVGVVVR